MSQTIVIDGTDQEIATLLQSGALAGHNLRLIVDPDPEDLTAGLAPPPFAVRDRDHLVSLLLEGATSLDEGKGIEVTPAYWDNIRHELKQRTANRNRNQ